MRMVQTLLTWVLAGALLGVLVASLVYPGMYAWYQTPGEGQSQELLNRLTIIQQSMSALLRAQLIGAGSGALVGLILGGLLVRARSKKLERTRATQGTPPPTGPTTPPVHVG